MPKSTPSPQDAPRIVTPGHVLTLAEEARERTFGFVVSERDRQLVLHGYLLALEEVMRG